jgi:hypothetical protein
MLKIELAYCNIYDSIFEDVCSEINKIAHIAR